MKKAIIILGIILVLTASVFYFRYQVYYSHGANKSTIIFKIEKGQGNGEIAANLAKEKIVSGQWYFYYYLRSHGLINKILPGEYELSGNMTIPEVAETITNKKEKFIKITFPEGWDSKKMAARLTENDLPGDEFLAIVNDPQDLKKRYSYLTDEKVKTLEGFLFPDTYFFKPDITAQNIVGRMLDNFDEKLTSDLRENLANQNIKIRDAIIMASIVEEEVASSSDRAVVSGIFWNRLAQGMPLQSDATLTYFLGDKKGSHSIAETHIDSPYNTYINKGLPPGPIDNPGLDAIKATANPQKTDYIYFLSDPQSGQTYFAKTLLEQSANKAKVGL